MKESGRYPICECGSETVEVITSSEYGMFYRCLRCEKETSTQMMSAKDARDEFGVYKLLL